MILTHLIHLRGKKGPFGVGQEEFVRGISFGMDTSRGQGLCVRARVKELLLQGSQKGF